MDISNRGPHVAHGTRAPTIATGDWHNTCTQSLLEISYLEVPRYDHEIDWPRRQGVPAHRTHGARPIFPAHEHLNLLKVGHGATADKLFSSPSLSTRLRIGLTSEDLFVGYAPVPIELPNR